MFTPTHPPLHRTLLIFYLSLAFSVSFFSVVGCLPLTSFGVLIPGAQGVALSADDSRCFVIADDDNHPQPITSVYDIPLPFNSSFTTIQPSPYWSTTLTVNFEYIAASVTTSPQLLYLLDYGQYGRMTGLDSLAITSPAPVNTTRLYTFSGLSEFGVTGMFYQSSSGLLYFSCQQGVSGSTFDFVGVIDPTASSPSLQTLYVTSFTVELSALAVSSTHLYFATFKQAVILTQIWAVPLSTPGSTSLIPNTTQTQLLYTYTNTSTAGPVYPAGFVLNNNESILYICDYGDDDIQPTISHAIYTLYSLHSAVTPLNLSTVYAGGNTQVQQSFALSPDQSTLYFAAVGNRNGIYVTTNANSSTLSPPTLSFSSLSSSASSTSSLFSSVSSTPTATSSFPLTATSRTSTSSPTGAVVSGSGATLPAGTFLQLTSFTFSDNGDVLSCLSADSTTTLGFAVSFGGDIFTWTIRGQPQAVSPVYVPGTGASAPAIAGCQVNPEGTQLYLIDTRSIVLYQYSIATPSVAPVVIASFPDEQIGTLRSLAIDFTSQVAYVGTFHTDNLYAVNISMTGQSLTAYDAIPLISDAVSLALSQDSQTLYYGSPAPAQGVPGTINSLQVQAGNVPYSGSPTLVYSSLNLIWPDALLVSGTTVYFKDGGPFQGEENNGEAEEMYSLKLGSTSATLLFSSTTVDLPSGMVMAADLSQLYFTTATTINTLLLTPQPVLTGSLCLLFYALPGNIDYPWSTASQLQVTYLPTVFSTSSGPAVFLLTVNGSRTYTNRFGSSFTSPVQLTLPSVVTLTNPLYLNSTTPFDSTGVTWNLPSAVQLPGNGPNPTTSMINVHSVASIVVEGSSTRVDGSGQAWLSSIPGFLNRTISAANINALAVNYGACQAPITFTNGLRSPTQPSVSNGVKSFQYSYSLSDGVSYAVSATLTMTTASAFATLVDQLGNPYQQVLNTTGTRLYTYLRTNVTVMSNVSGLSTAINANADQRFYPYALLSSAPGVYSINTAPFTDFDGIEFNVSPAVPANGAVPGGQPLYAAVRVFFSTPEPTAVLTEANSESVPVVAFQQQSYRLD